MTATTREKAAGLLKDGHVHHQPGARVYTVKQYTVALTPTGDICTCPAFGRCSHIAAAALLDEGVEAVA